MPTFGRVCFGEISRDSPHKLRHAITCGVGGILSVDPPRRASRKLQPWQSLSQPMSKAVNYDPCQREQLAYSGGECMFPKFRLRIHVPQADVAALRDSAMHCSYHDTRRHDKCAAPSRKLLLSAHAAEGR